MLLARNAEIAWKVHGMFKRREVRKSDSLTAESYH